MLLAALIVGGLTAYWLGLRPGAWAAVATLALLLLAVIAPPLALFIHVGLAVSVLAVCVYGSRRERPADAVRATRWVRATLGRLVTIARARSSKRPPSNGV
jgi:membrane protein implicated in regulation of membrane protease activity